MTRFDDDTAVRRIGDGIYETSISKNWWVVRGPHGGYLATILLRALSAELDDASRGPRSLTVHYPAAPSEGTVHIETETVRAGGNLTTMSARMTQEGTTLALAVAAFSKPFEGLEFSDAVMPDSLPPDEGFPVQQGENLPRFLMNFDMRWTLGDPPFSGSDHARLGGWFRLAEPQIADEFVVATLMDAWAPVVFPPATAPLVAPTIDLTIHFREPLPPPGAAADDYYLGVFSSKLSHQGFFEEDGELWSKDGRLLAQSRQLALTLIPRG